MLLNLTNHPVKNWGTDQLSAAVSQWKEVSDFPFPAVNTSWDTEDIAQRAERIAEQILSCKPDAVLCQGEMTLCFALIQRLQQHGIPVCAAVSDRVVKEALLPDGTVKKEVSFRFVKFRNYPNLMLNY
jgi:hypothetical protein